MSLYNGLTDAIKAQMEVVYVLAAGLGCEYISDAEKKSVWTHLSSNLVGYTTVTMVLYAFEKFRDGLREELGIEIEIPEIILYTRALEKWLCAPYSSTDYECFVVPEGAEDIAESLEGVAANFDGEAKLPSFCLRLLEMVSFWAHEKQKDGIITGL